MNVALIKASSCTLITNLSTFLEEKMKNTKLTWFDRLMVGITFAEAGVDDALLQSKGGDRNHRYILSREQEELFEPGRDSSIPAHT